MQVLGRIGAVDGDVHVGVSGLSVRIGGYVAESGRNALGDSECYGALLGGAAERRRGVGARGERLGADADEFGTLEVMELEGEILRRVGPGSRHHDLGDSRLGIHGGGYGSESCGGAVLPVLSGKPFGDSEMQGAARRGPSHLHGSLGAGFECLGRDIRNLGVHQHAGNDQEVEFALHVVRGPRADLVGRIYGDYLVPEIRGEVLVRNAEVYFVAQLPHAECGAAEEAEQGPVLCRAAVSVLLAVVGGRDVPPRGDARGISGEEKDGPPLGLLQNVGGGEEDFEVALAIELFRGNRCAIHNNSLLYRKLRENLRKSKKRMPGSCTGHPTGSMMSNRECRRREGRT